MIIIGFSMPATLTCFSSGSILHCWACTPTTILSIISCPCCNPVLSTWYCRVDCNSPPSTCIIYIILSYHWYSKSDSVISTYQYSGHVIISLNLASHCCICNSAYCETWDTEEKIWRKKTNSMKWELLSWVLPAWVSNIFWIAAWNKWNSAEGLTILVVIQLKRKKRRPTSFSKLAIMTSVVIDNIYLEKYSTLIQNELHSFKLVHLHTCSTLLRGKACIAMVMTHIWRNIRLHTLLQYISANYFTSMTLWVEFFGGFPSSYLLVWCTRTDTQMHTHDHTHACTHSHAHAHTHTHAHTQIHTLLSLNVTYLLLTISLLLSFLLHLTHYLFCFLSPVGICSILYMCT